MNQPEVKANNAVPPNVALLHPQRPSGGPRSAATEWPEALSALIEFAIGLGAEPDREGYLASVLKHTVQLTGADAGAILVRDRDGSQRTEVAIGDYARYAGLGAVASGPVPFHPLEPDRRNAADAEGGVVSVGRRVELIARGVRDGRELNASSDRAVSVLSLPLTTSEGSPLGALQLVHGADADGSAATDAAGQQRLLLALAAQAAMVLENRALKARELGHFEAIVNMVMAAVDAKSPYTAGHCRRVPIIYEMLAEAACKNQEAPFSGFNLSADQRRELRIAAWLHDCGKLATPEHVVDKATKLECVYDRLHEVAVRIEVLKRDEEIACLEASIRDPENAAGYRADLYVRLRHLDEDYWFLSQVNRGGETMTDAMVERVRAIASLRWRDHSGLSRPLLDDDEVRNLCIRRGTLNETERQIINQHVEVSIAMLQELSFPTALAQVQEIAGKHHEMIDGSGYPYGLTGDAMSLPARMLVIADIFEALTAGDRPYKKGKTLSEALTLMAGMRDAGKIDADIFDLFLTSRVWQAYADEHMTVDYRDGVDIEPLLSRRGQDDETTRLQAGC